MKGIRRWGMFVGLCCLLSVGWTCYLDPSTPSPLIDYCERHPTDPACPNPVQVLDASDRERRPTTSDGSVLRLCGNGACDIPQGENCASCPADCACPQGRICFEGVCQSCGNGTCDTSLGETCASCSLDCSCPISLVCENGQCLSPVRCGDGKCQKDKGEHCGNCYQDCQCAPGQSCQATYCQDAARCGNGKCEVSNKEDCSTCPADCACQRAGEGCRKGLCVPCTCKPGAFRCTGTTLEKCASHCMAYQKVRDCNPADNLICDASRGSCQCRTDNQCSPPGDARCASYTVAQRCFQGQHCTFWQDQVCPAKTDCDKGRCCVCIRGDARCYAGKMIQTCDNDCDWSLPKACAPLTLCYQKDAYTAYCK